MRTKIVILSILLIFFTQTLVSQTAVSERITMFNSETETPGWIGVVLGRVVSLGVREIADEDLRQLAQERTKVTVRLQSKEGILKGDTLYIVNAKNLIVSRFEVITITESRSFGYLLVGYGNFRRVQTNFRVVQHSKESAGKTAYIHKARGDYHRKNGDVAKAIVEYERSVHLNDKYAESHIELGYIYLKKNIYQYALRAFEKAYKARAFIYDNEDLLRLYSGIIQVRSYNAYTLEISNRAIIKRNIDEGIKVAKEASEKFPDVYQFHFDLGRFYYENPESQDVKAKYHFLKVIELRPDHVESLVMLAELYLKHNNPDRATSYARKALESDPTNNRARDIVYRVEN
ncbi:MAG: tetratricopeptide repeat protein [Spirochaetes bacterium]|jgi:tetratricopeptide (TPR) repeat protein|nr:tetratricopeptide repeat protein [Spirochaetota bacterium]